MPVKVKKIRDKFRIIEIATGRLAKRKSGKPVDGGGHDGRAKADAQARAINSSGYKKK